MHDFIDGLRKLVEFAFSRGWVAAERHYGLASNTRTVADARSLQANAASHALQVLADLHDHTEAELRT